ncbi:uncharacterized protein LOC106641193 [Copidosoma floridanum]|uniref:uncharacterized protein LOC106641193 n=1 Tax=Copidosoma floridanum TaxID=29053 RepID=UPI0006C9B732|nr:uncharacterized protein LOC106641193 [Copidosoma floridanum]
MVDNSCIIEGNVKFRDGKKWKSRWCVMRKLSPVADCLHLQLYGDSKDRYKQGQTKASLSLQHFLGVQSGFTLDKESNTIAIICQDVTVVLAFDTRERLIQWQVKISNNLGEDQEFLVLLSSAPAKAKLNTGPAQLHVREQRFCMTSGVPPRLLGTWEIGQLRRYGVVEGRFCFEGGSRCGRGEGLHVLITDQAEEIARALQLAAEDKLIAQQQLNQGPQRTNARLHLLDSPRRQPFDSCELFSPSTSSSSAYWASAESRQQEPDSASLLSELAATADHHTLHLHHHHHQPQQQQGTDWRSCSLSRQQHVSAACLERCSSCISKLGGMSKSSTCATTATLASSGASSSHLGHLQPRGAFDRISLSSYSSSNSNSHDSDYSAAGSPQPALIPRPGQAMPQQLPPRPPKPSNAAAGGGPIVKRPNKPPMPLPLEPSTTCTCAVAKRAAAAAAAVPSRSATTAPGPYENYDIPKTMFHHSSVVGEQQSPQAEASLNYDTPRKIKECLAMPKAYPNYDTPLAPQAVVLQQCGCPAKLPAPVAPTPQLPKVLGCPCQNVMSWAGFVLPYCRRGAGIEPTGVSMQPVRLSGEGKMPVVNANGQLTIYSSPSSASVEANQSTTRASSNDCECPVHPSFEGVTAANYENVEPVIDTQPEPKSANYANIEFTESLGNYENSKVLLSKVGVGSLDEMDNQKRENQQQQIEDRKEETEEDANKSGVCHKCGHPKEASSSSNGSHDYLVVDEENDAPEKKPVPGYLPMQPAHNACSKEVLSRLCSGVKSSSNPALSGSSSLESSRKRSESEYRVPGSAMLSSPYFRRRLLDMSASSTEVGAGLGMLLRKRSYSAESAHCLDDDKSPTAAGAQHKCSNTDEKQALTNNEAAADSKNETTTATTNGSPQGACLSPQALNPPLASIKIRRSSSVPSKTGQNRDSSSSNDSGVSTGSLSHRTAEFVEFEFPLAPANTLIKKQSVPHVYRKSPPLACFHGSLPRKSKSSDPLKEITFQFHKIKLPAKSSSAEADITTCLPSKASKEFNSPGEASSIVPYIDSRSTSSGTSDMSDYIETLSLSSHSSSDAPDNLRVGGRAVATTLRPRSGKEYYKIDRSILVEQGQPLGASSNYANIVPCARKETPRHPVT